MKNLTLILAIILAQGLLVLAQNGGAPADGTDSFKFAQDSKGRDCYVYSGYLVAASPTKKSDGGYDLFVYRRNRGKSRSAISSGSICLNNKQKPYLTIYSEFNQSFAGLVGDSLLADNGTGPDLRQLKIYNLKTKNHYSITYHQAFGVTDNRYLNYPRYVGKKIPLKQCANAKKWQKDGFGITWVRQVKLDLHTFKETPVGKVYCEATQ